MWLAAGERARRVSTYGRRRGAALGVLSPPLREPFLVLAAGDWKHGCGTMEERLLYPCTSNTGLSRGGGCDLPFSGSLVLSVAATSPVAPSLTPTATGYKKIQLALRLYHRAAREILEISPGVLGKVGPSERTLGDFAPRVSEWWVHFTSGSRGSGPGTTRVLASTAENGRRINCIGNDANLTAQFLSLSLCRVRLTSHTRMG